MAAPDTEIELLVDLYEEHGVSLHRLAVLLGAEEASGHILRTSLLALGRKVNSVVDPLERLEYLQEQVVHQSRGARGSDGRLLLPAVEDSRQQEILDGVATLPVRVGELLVISHYLSVFGPELAGILRMTIRTTNARLEEALGQLRQLVGDPTPGTQPGAIESLSQEVTAALRSSGRLVQPSGTETLAAELLSLGDSSTRGVTAWLVVPIMAVSLAVGMWLATITAPGRTVEPTAPPSVTASATGTATPTPSSTPSTSLPAQVRAVPVYYVGRQDGLLYRELRDLPASRVLVQSALEATMSLLPLDPDYDSAWGLGTLIGVEVTGETLTVDLSPPAFEGITTAAQARSAVNQMVYTASELTGIPTLRVKFLADGQPPPEVFAQPAEGFARTGLSPMPAVWIRSPKNGAVIPAGQVVVDGTVKSQAAAPMVSITDASGEVIVSVTAQTATTPDADGWRLWSMTSQLAPGEYLLTAVTDMPDAIGAVQSFVETKSITIE